MEMREAHGEDAGINNQLQYFLDRLFMMRISIRMLASQHCTFVRRCGFKAELFSNNRLSFHRSTSFRP